MDQFFYAILLWSVGIVQVILANRQYGKFINPVSIFTFMWNGLGSLAAFGAADLYPIGFKAVMTMILSSFVFAITCIHFQGRNNRRYGRDLVFIDTGVFCIKRIVILNIIALGVVVILSQKMLTILLTEGFVSARFYFLTSSQNGVAYSTMQVYLLYICFAVFTATILVAVQNFLSRGKNYILYIFSVIDLIAYVVAIAGRKVVLIFIIFVITGIISSRVKIRLKLFQKLMIMCAVIALAFITSERLLGGSIVRNIILYFVGTFGLLNIALDFPKQFALSTGLTYGRNMFGFMLTPFEIAYKVISNDQKFMIVDAIISKVSENYYYVAPDIRMNHSYTAAWYFMCDFGYIGIIIGFALLGYFVSVCYGKSCANTYRSPFWQCMYLYMVMVIIFTVIDFQISWTTTVMVLCMIYFTRKGRYSE